jgi:hypothetical protein
LATVEFAKRFPCTSQIVGPVVFSDADEVLPYTSTTGETDQAITITTTNAIVYAYAVAVRYKATDQALLNSVAAAATTTIVTSTGLFTISAAAPPNSDPSASHGLSSGAKAGIAIGTILGVVALGVGIFIFLRLRRKKAQSQTETTRGSDETLSKAEPIHNSYPTVASELEDTSKRNTVSSANVISELPTSRPSVRESSQSRVEYPFRNSGSHVGTPEMHHAVETVRAGDITTLVPPASNSLAAIPSTVVPLTTTSDQNLNSVGSNQADNSGFRPTSRQTDDRQRASSPGFTEAIAPSEVSSSAFMGPQIPPPDDEEQSIDEIRQQIERVKEQRLTLTRMQELARKQEELERKLTAKLKASQ